MNNDITILIINSIHSQQILNNRKEKLRGKQHQFVGFSICEWFVENLLRVYAVYYQYGYIIIHQINVFTVIIKSIEIIS